MKRPSSGNRCLTINESRTMKKIYSFMVAAVALFAAASCNKELPQENLPAVGETVVYTASTDGADTKAVLDGTVSKWCGEELITLHDGTNAFTFYANAGETPVSKVDFTYTPGEGQPGFTAKEVMAVYPSGDYTANLDEKIVSNVVVPNNQTLEDNTYPATAAVAVAYSTTTELSFKNATTLLKFKVDGDDVTYGCFLAEGAISGKFAVNYNEGKPLMTAMETTKYVDFHMNGAPLSKEATYYIAIAPAEVENFKIFLNGQEIKTYAKSYKFERNVILDLGTLKYVAPEIEVDYWAVIGSMTSNWNSEIEMTLKGDWYVAENVKILASDQFKFRANGNWDEGTPNRGAAGDAEVVLIENDVETAVYQGGKNFCVSEGGFYSLYINKSATKVKVVKTADLPVESVPDQPSDWALWAQSPDWKQIDMVTTTVPDLYVAKGVVLEAYKSFLVKPAADWSTKYGCGAVNYIQSDKYINVSQNGGDITVEAAGTYDIYFDNINKNVYLMTSGVAYTSATQQTTSGVEPEPEPEPETGVTIYLKPGVWETGGARYQAWIWGAGDQWVTFTKVSDGLYSTKVPEGTTGMKVLRKGPDHANNAWQSWNDTGDVTLGGKNCIEITGWNQSYSMSTY